MPDDIEKNSEAGEATRSDAGRSGKTRPLPRESTVNRELAALLRNSLRPVLVVVSGKRTGRRITLTGNSVLGRDPGTDAVLDDDGVSWRHARIEDRGDSWAIVDLGSMNGTIVRGERVEEAVLADGDSLMIGDTLLRVELRSAVERKLTEELQRVVDMDDLTGLYVRRKFDELVEGTIRRARHLGDVVGMLVMDMDGIKRINDTHGHLFGAHAIGETGGLIGKVLGDRGFACRFGGDEFIAVLPGHDHDAAAAVADEILSAVGSHRYERKGIVFQPGISIGVGVFPDDGADPTALFEHTDQAMYRAKQAGGHRMSR